MSISRSESRSWIRQHTANSTVVTLSLCSRKSWKERLLWDQAGVGFDRELLVEAGDLNDSLSFRKLPLHSLDHAAAWDGLRSCIWR